MPCKEVLNYIGRIKRKSADFELNIGCKVLDGKGDLEPKKIINKHCETARTPL